MQRVVSYKAQQWGMHSNVEQEMVVMQKQKRDGQTWEKEQRS